LNATIYVILLAEGLTGAVAL